MLTSANASGGREYPERHCPNFVVRHLVVLARRTHTRV
jgi:hypothetical protein